MFRGAYETAGAKFAQERRQKCEPRKSKLSEDDERIVAGSRQDNDLAPLFCSALCRLNWCRRRGS
jgi:hypothetical protein